MGLMRLMGLMGLMRPMRLMGLLAVCLFLAGCQNDSVEPEDNRPRSSMELLSFSTSFLETTPWITRADPAEEFHFPTGY